MVKWNYEQSVCSLTNRTITDRTDDGIRTVIIQLDDTDEFAQYAFNYVARTNTVENPIDVIEVENITMTNVSELNLLQLIDMYDCENRSFILYTSLNNTQLNINFDELTKEHSSLKVLRKYLQNNEEM